MKIHKRLFPGIGLMGLGLLALMILQSAVTTRRSWADDKPAVSTAPQGALAEIKIPRGTPDALTAILTRRSIREYTPHPVPEEMIKLLLEAGMSAPSAFDERSTESIVINDRQIIDEIHKFNPKRPQLKKATVAIMVCGNQDKEKFKGKGFRQLDGAVASEKSLSPPMPWAWGRYGPRFIRSRTGFPRCRRC
jgi:Nitroreductase family